MYWHTDSIAKQSIMLADKSGLRPKSKIKKTTKDDEKVAEINAEIGRKLRDKYMTDSERAELIRQKRNSDGRK